MIPPFRVLDREQNIHSSYLLEASAGTGKTYSIENIVVRLLIDKAIPCTLSNILVVTFTKASTSDLKARIRLNIHKTLAMLRQQSQDDPPDYLCALLEAETEVQNYAKQQLEQALACFEQAPIFTIHGFCHRMLKEHLFEADVGASLGDSEEGISPSLLYKLIRDFFRTEMSDKLISFKQLQLVLSHTGSVEKLEKELYKLISKGIAIAPMPCLQERLTEFNTHMHALKEHVKASPEQILEDFVKQAPLYKEICNRQKIPKEENVAKVQRFAALLEKTEWDLNDFDVLIADGVYVTEALLPENLGSKKLPLPAEQLHCPHLVERLNQHLVPTVAAARNPYFILSTLAHRCKEMVQAYLEQKEIFGFDDLLTSMYRAVQLEGLPAKIRERFTTAIIDEFQDTDPVQWEIFQKIFLPENQPAARLFLVGDPKQSIYGFRQADIYTYLAAGKALGQESKASLNTNYRSVLPLVNALNALFCHETAPGLMALPRLDQTLSYQPVQSGADTAFSQLNDARGAIHFFCMQEQTEGKAKKLAEVEESFFLPFICEELSQLHSQGIALNTCAVLVADRFQAGRLMQHLKAHKIPTVAQHAESLSKTVAFASMQELLQAILTPQRESTLKIALAGPLLGWTQPQVEALDNLLLLESLFGKALALRKVWLQQGFSSFFEAFLASKWQSEDTTVAEFLLSKEDGISLYHCIQQVAELLIDRESVGNLLPHQLLNSLDEIRLLEKSGDQQFKQRANPEKEGVRILTIHSSKGLEFEFVFALGVINRSKSPSQFVPTSDKASENNFLPLLTAVADCHDPRYIHHALELDAEKIRQVYVAFTRAKQRLYIPLLFQPALKECEFGAASPIELYLSMMGKPEIPFTGLYERISQLDATSTLDFIRELGRTQAITISTSEDPIKQHLTSESAIDVKLASPPKPLIKGAPCFMHSFTSLSSSAEEEELPSEQDPNVTFLLRPPNDFECSNKSAHTLPAGALTGTLLHTLMECISFEAATLDEVHAFIERFLKNTPFEKWGTVIGDIIFKTLSLQLTINTSIFRLKNLPSHHCYREHPFVYSGTRDIHPDLAFRPGYMQGVVDLIFKHGDKYCIIDWKSNWLGPDTSYYSQAHMQNAMRAHDYFLQAEIYKEALRRYLKLIDDRPFEDIFGGTFYVFMRGLEKDGHGVFKVG